MKKGTLKKANDLAEQIRVANNEVMAYRIWIEVLEGKRPAKDYSPRTWPMFDNYIEAGVFVKVGVSMTQFKFLVSLELEAKKEQLSRLEAELAALQDEDETKNEE